MLLAAALAVACNPLGKISVTNIVNPDDVKPELRFVTAAPKTTDLAGAREKLIEFEIRDNQGGSGIKEAQLYYSPDAGVRFPYKLLKEYEADPRFADGIYSIKFCTPNKVHPKPTFKLVAVDKNKNEQTVYLGSGIDEEFAIVPSPPMVPTITSSNGLLTNAGSTTITIDSCRKDLCSADALYYEAPTNETFISIHDSSGSPTWVSCEDVLEDGLTLPLPADGSVSYTVQTKEEDVDLDGTPLPPIVSLVNDPADTDDPLDPTDTFFNPDLPPTVITINKDSTNPTGAVVTAAGPMSTHEDFAVTFNFADGNSGIESAKLFYSPDAGATYPYIELGSFTTGSPVTMNFCVPHKDHASGAFQLRATDLAGNAITQTQAGFTTALTANPVLPNVTSVTTVTPRSNNTSTIRIDACPQTACTSGNPSLYGPIDNQTYIAVSPTAPTATAPIWQSCADVLANGYTYTLPSTPTGTGSHTAARLWVKSENQNQANDATLATVSTASRALSLPWDYTPPATLNLDLGNIGNNRNLEILGTSILTGYSQGSFRLSPVCLDPTYLPPAGFIAGTVTVSANNVNVTGTGTSFTTEFRNSDYTEINGIYTQIKTVVSDTQLILNENPGNTPGLVGSGLVASKAIPSYGGIYVQKGTTAPAGADPNWQSCDSTNQTITFGDLVNGINNLNFWVKDQGNNVSTSYLSFAVNYTAPILTVVDGPTISTQIADITINACGGGTRITHVLFNETGVQPAATDPAWQTCSTATGALKSDVLAPGNHVLKAYFKYTDNFVSVNPVDVVVNYLPQVAWVETPLTNRPQTTYTLASCTGITDVFVNQGTAPLATDVGWQPCSTAAGAISYTLSSTGSQTVNFWYKSGSVVSSDFSEATVNFVPPSASIFGGSLVRTTTPPLSLNSCEGIDRIFIEVDDSLGATAPTLVDFSGPNGRACTTALNGIIPPPVVGEGNHTYDVWYKFTDNYILDPWFSRVSVTYLEADSTPPPVLAGDGATQPLTITLENTQVGTPELVTSQTPRTTIINTSARALFTLNSCTPKTPIALVGTVSVPADGLIVTGVGTSFTTALAPADYVLIAGQTVKVKSIESDTQLTLVLAHTAGATNSSASEVFPDDEITGMMVTTSGTKPLANDPFWLPCSTAATLLRTPTLTNGPYTVSAWFKDASGNVSNAAILKDIEITNGDTTPPDRPVVIVENAPTLTSAPARLTIPNCLDVDQVYIETSDYPAPYTAPPVDAPQWQNCTTNVGSIIYNVNLAGPYTVSVWFKDAAGNMNPIPRDVAFIFDPAIGNLPEPIAYWTMDQTHILKNRVIDAKGNSHLYVWDPANVTPVTGRNKQALQLSGTNSYLFTENTSVLKPAISVTLSMWAHLTANDAGTKGLAGNGSYGLKLEGGFLRFYASRVHTVSVPTSSYSTGWHHIIGTSDGRYVNLYLDGQPVGTPVDLGAAANLDYDNTVPLFVVGGLTNNASPNPLPTGLFNERVDEVVVWNQYFTPQMALDHYIDAFNNYKVRQDSVPPADIASATFYGEFMQNALITLPTCNGAKFIYLDETTHPPTPDRPEWQLCNTIPGGIVHPNLAQGGHELKIWAKDEYDNVSTGYLKLDTTITGIVYQAPAVAYYTFDNTQNDIARLFDIFSGHTALNFGADGGFAESGTKNEAYGFVRASNDYIERKYAFNLQPKTELSISVLAKLVQNNDIQQTLAGTRTSGHGYDIEINNAANELRFNVETSGGTRSVGVPISSYTTGYHNVIGVYDGRISKLYIDGLEAASVDHLTTAPIQYQCLGSFTMGAGATCNSGPVAGTHFNGVLDEVIVWDDALAAITIFDFFNGQDKVPPQPVDVNPKDNQTTIGIPVARFNVEANGCNDISAVYVTLDEAAPLSDIANWQPCSETGDRIKSPLLDNGVNQVYFWFKDAAGNVSLTRTQIAMTLDYDFTIPEPKSYWTLDDVNVDGAVATDVVNGKNGIITGALETVGQVSEALAFDGIDDFIEVPFDSSFRPVQEVTLSTWFKVSSYIAGDKHLVGNLNAGGYGIVLNDTTLSFRIHVDPTAGTPELATISTTLDGTHLNQWNHVVAVYGTGTLRLFLNGAEILPTVTATSVNKEIAYPAGNNSLVIGAGAPVLTGTSGGYFAGGLDEVAFWDAALSDTVVEAIYERGLDEDQIYYDVQPPEVPTNLNITYYNSLVSRANLTVSSCAGLDYIIVTKDEFPPDKNDINWQRCNTLVGGLLSKELSTADSFGKLWTKDNFGNVSRNFEYVPINTPYDKPISRPVVHWTFDNVHYVAGTRTAFDRLSQINLKSETLLNTQPYDGATNCLYTQGLDTTKSVLQVNQAGVLNQGFRFERQNTDVAPSITAARPVILRANHPENAKTKPTDSITVSAWVFLDKTTLPTSDGTLEMQQYDRHIVSSFANGKGWALSHGSFTGGVTTLANRSFIFKVTTNNGPFRSYLEDSNLKNGWHLITGSFDGSNVSLFVDGIFVKSFATPPSSKIVYEPGANTFVGSQASTTALPSRFQTHSITGSCFMSTLNQVHNYSYFTNRIEEVLIWDQPLSRLEVSSLYHNGADVLYSSDTTPPPQPYLVLENTRPDMFSNKAYFTLRSNPVPSLNDPCGVFPAVPQSDSISGVLVNEGTMPDKQDARWESCRARRGSFGLEDLTPGGHTITVWFKDLAGNVTPTSSDVVVNFIDGALPSANAVWPLDASHAVSKYSVDVIDQNVHDLQLVNFDSPLNPGATTLAPGDSVVKEGLNLASASATTGAFLTTPVTTLLTPVNYMTVGGWFYLTGGDTATKVLVDTHRVVASPTGRHGYKLFLSGGQLRFLAELNIAGQQTVTYPMSSVATGWNHVLGVFTGTRLTLFVNGTEIGAPLNLSERDFINYDDGTSGVGNAVTDFRVGAESEVNANPSSFFGSRIDELGLWGFDLTLPQVTSIYTAPATQSHFYDPLPAPVRVENAFIYHYDNFGSRARMTILNCTNTPYILVQDQGAPSPSGDDVEWRLCNTIPGAILSKKLSLATGGLPSYVDVYAKNADGVVSTVAGRKEILPVIYDYDLVLPITYFSFNDNQRTTTRDNDFVIRNFATLSNAPARAANADGHEYVFNGLSTPAGSIQGINVANQKIYDLREGISLAVWTHITAGDTATRRIVSRDSTPDETALLLEGGALKFRINIPSLNSLIRSTVLVDATYATANISTGRHFVVGTYDGLFVRLYLDGMLVGETNVRYRNYDATSAKARIDMDSIQGFRLGATGGAASPNGAVDEFMVFDRVLTEGDIVSWYKRYNQVLNTPDAVAPAGGRPLAVVPSAAGADVNEQPVYTIGDCTDIAGVFVSLSSTPPSEFDDGWQYCQTHEGYITGPVLNPGANTVYFFYKDQFGNVTLAGDTVLVNYNPPARPNPVAYWTMDDNSVIGQRIYEPVNQLHANLYGVLPADFVAAGVATGVQLNGTRKYVEVNHSPILKPTQELSVSFWMNVPGANEDRSNKTVLGTRSSAEGYMFRWTCNPNGSSIDGTNTPCGAVSPASSTTEFFEFVLRLEDGSDQVLDVPQALIGTGGMHIVGTYDGRFMKLYRNGVLLRTKDLKVDREIFYNATANTSLVIGARVGAYEKPAGEYFPGVVDEVAIFDKALTQAHVTELSGYITSDTRIFDPGRALLANVPEIARRYEPGLKTYGNRLRLTMSSCVGTDMILVSDSIVAPAANDENWQPCNTYDGGILSAPLPSGSVTPQVWAKTFDGRLSTTPGTLDGPNTVTMPTFARTIPRPRAIWSLDSEFSGAAAGFDIREHVALLDGTMDALGAPDTTVVQLAGTVTIAANSVTVTGSATTFLTDLAPGDRIKIAGETVQILSVASDTSATLVNEHINGAVIATPYYRLGKINDVTSVIEGGYNFNGINDFMTFRPTAASNPYYQISISAWAELRKGETLHRHIVGNHQNALSATGAGAGLKVQGGQLKFFVSTIGGAGYYEVGIDTNLYSTGLHHVTGTFDGRDLVLYLDGVFVKRNAIPLFGAASFQLVHDDFSHWTIGAEAGTYTPGGTAAATTNTFFRGVIDEVNLWHTALTEQEVFYTYEFGSAHLPTAISDGIPPTDPGIFITNGQTIQSSPWTQFTMPTCVGANGTEINAIFVSTTATAPDKDAIGWQFCSRDAGYIISQLLDEGPTTLYVWFRDEEGDVTGGAYPPVQFNVNYVPPALIRPLAYYKFDSAPLVSGNYFLTDSAGTKHVRADEPSGYTTFVAGKRGSAFIIGNAVSGSTNGLPITATYKGEYDSTRNFAVAFWYYAAEPLFSTGILLDQGQYRITRTASDTISVFVDHESDWDQVKATQNRIKDQAWNHVAVTREGSSLRIYLNGRLDSSHVIPNADLIRFSNKSLTVGGERGYYDELVLYGDTLTADQVANLYYRGEKNFDIDTFTPNYVAARAPDVYWDFNSVNDVAGYLNPIKGALPLRKVNAIANDASGRVAQAFQFTRFEDALHNAPNESPTNVIGPQQYLESDAANPLALGSDFTMSLWVKQPVSSGYGAAPSVDQTAVIDLWGHEDYNKSFTLTYNRSAAPASAKIYSFSFRNNNSTVTLDTSSTYDNFNSVTGWNHFVIRKKSRLVTLYVNGLETSSVALGNDQAIPQPRNTRFRIGNSSLYSFYHIPGTVSVPAGTNVVTGVGTSFLTDLFTPKTGTISVVDGSNIVTGVGTDFLNELPGTNVQIIKLGTEFRVVASVQSATSLTLATNYVGPDLAGEPYRARHTNAQVRIGLQNATIASINSDTELTLVTNHVAGASAEKLGINISANNTAPIDEYALNGSVDELAIWNTALTQRQIIALTALGNAGTAVPIEPLASLVNLDGNTTVTTSTANFQLSDCNGYSEIWIGDSGDSTPLAGDAGWVACDANTTYTTGLLNPGVLNTIVVWFKTGGVVSGHTTSFDVTQSGSPDTTPPVVPGGNLTLVTASPTSNSFARFTLSSCADGAGFIAGVKITLTPGAPSPLASDWQSCTTAASALVSPPLVPGANNLYAWFKDAAGNVSTSLNYSITYNPPALSASIFSLPFDMAQINDTTKFIKDIVANELAKGFNPGNLLADRVGQVDRAVNFTTNAYYDFAYANPTLTTALSAFSWVNLSASASGSHIIGRWDDDAANDSWALRVDSTGRVCFDAQTTASTGVWNTDAYKRMCSSERITFAKWQHVGVVRNGATVDLYINNKKVGIDSMSALPLKTTTLGVRVGAQERGSATAPVEGLLDELHVWDVALSAAQIEAVYAAGVSGVPLFAEPAAYATLFFPANYWPFDSGTPLDDSAPTDPIHLTNAGADFVPFGAGAKVGDHYNFISAESDRIVSAPVSLNLSADFTLSLWVKPTTLTATDILSKWNTALVAEQEFKLSLTAGGIVSFSYQLATPAVGSITSIETIPAGAWTHITVARRGPALYLYLNGRPQAVQDLGAVGILDLAARPLIFGGNTTTTATYFNGAIDDVVLYKDYLNERNIRFNIDRGNSNNPLPVGP